MMMMMFYVVFSFGFMFCIFFFFSKEFSLFSFFVSSVFGFWVLFVGVVLFIIVIGILVLNNLFM